ncbi:MAG: hypothetical protein NTW95_13315 [Candidatus Aminicenantes bacterium]|nr:hypothetical protein [Candidatus Aminicenantes bacterium]
MKRKIDEKGISELIRKPGTGKWHVRIDGKEYGPWDKVDRPFKYSPDGKHWALTGKLHDKYYVLADGCKYGPFNFNIKGPWFDPCRGVFVFTAQRDNEFFLVAGGEVIRKGSVVEKPGGEMFITVSNKHFGPYQDVELPLFSPSGKKWAAALRRDDKGFLLLNGKEYGPFRAVERPEFSRGGELCTCPCRDDKGQGLLVEGEKFYGPFEQYFGPWYSLDGKHWGLDIQKKKWHGFLVDGIEYGPFPFQYFVPEFSPDGKHWAVMLDGNSAKRRFILLDGKKYGPYDISNFAFTVDNHCLSLFRRKGNYIIFIDGREIGPYCHADKKLHPIDGAVLADLVFVIKGKKAVRRCVISCSPEDSEKQIFFSPKTGESLKEAIEIINAVDTDEGVYAEYAYLRLKSQSLGIVYSMVEQQHIPHGGKHYDMLTIQLENGEKENFFFDITSFYGKFSPEIERWVKTGAR